MRGARDEQDPAARIFLQINKLLFNAALPLICAAINCLRTAERAHIVMCACMCARVDYELLQPYLRRGLLSSVPLFLSLYICRGRKIRSIIAQGGLELAEAVARMR